MEKSKQNRRLELERTWRQLKCRWNGIDVAVYEYLKGQAAEDLMSEHRRFLADIRMVEYVSQWKATIAFAVRDARRNLVGILNTKLEGNRYLSNVKKTCYLDQTESGIVGSSVHFGEPAEALMVSVGIESALIIAVATQRTPTWAALGATGLRTLQVPERVRTVSIYADFDPTDTIQESSFTLADRLRAEGRTVNVRIPPCSIPGMSGYVRWHDVWMLERSRMWPM